MGFRVRSLHQELSSNPSALSGHVIETIRTINSLLDGLTHSIHGTKSGSTLALGTQIRGLVLAALSNAMGDPLFVAQLSAVAYNDNATQPPPASWVAANMSLAQPQPVSR